MEFEFGEYTFEINATYDYADYAGTTGSEIMNSTSNFSRLPRLPSIRRAGIGTSSIVFNVTKLVHSSLIVILNGILLICIIATGLKKRQLGNHLYFVCNFSIADLLVGIEGVVNCAMYLTIIFSRTMSIFHNGLFKMLISASLFLFLSHAFLQWRAIRRPLNVRVEPVHLMWILTALSWLTALGIGCLGTWLKYRTNVRYAPEYMAFKIFELSLYFVNSVAICIFYVLVLLKIQKKRRKANSVVPDKASSISVVKESMTPKDSGQVTGMASPSARGSRENSDGLRLNCISGRSPYNPRKATLTSLTVAAVHIACSIPYIIFYICYFHRDPNDQGGLTMKLYINGIVLTMRSLLLPIIFMRRTPEIYSRLCSRWAGQKQLTRTGTESTNRIGARHM